MKYCQSCRVCHISFPASANEPVLVDIGSQYAAPGDGMFQMNFSSAASLVSKFDLPGLVNVNKKLWKDPPVYSWANPLFLWHLSIPFLVYQAG